MNFMVRTWIVLLVGVVASNMYGVATLRMPTITQEQARIVGNKIWRNECGGSYDKLLFWSPSEPFPSFGIGHFIWFPKGHDGHYMQRFPALITFMQEHGVSIPPWLMQCIQDGCPWATREEFYKDIFSPRLQELKTLLSSTIDIQAQFLVELFYQALPTLVDAAADKDRDAIITAINTLASTAPGIYALIDYNNFKGTGINPKERYKNQGWGLLQVLEYIVHTQQPVTVQAFAHAAEEMLRQRVTNAPEGSPDAQRLAGWLNRVKTYQQIS